MAVGTAVPLAVLAVVLATAAWVYADARSSVRKGAPVVLSIGSFRVDTPEVWAAGCVVVCVLFVPLYLAARRRER